MTAAGVDSARISSVSWKVPGALTWPAAVDHPVFCSPAALETAADDLSTAALPAVGPVQRPRTAQLVSPRGVGQPAAAGVAGANRNPLVRLIRTAHFTCRPRTTTGVA